MGYKKRIMSTHDDDACYNIYLFRGGGGIHFSYLYGIFLAFFF